MLLAISRPQLGVFVILFRSSGAFIPQCQINILENNCNKQPNLHIAENGKKSSSEYIYRNVIKVQNIFTIHKLGTGLFHLKNRFPYLRLNK